ncbi:MAG TPA: M28 family peptidase, partial [Hanamia sp.]|nr:M28 family peptidase [Hanamia sp.]
INCDMVGRLNDSSPTITIGGLGTSPVWGKILPAKTKSLSVKFDSSGIGPSDHTSFYLKNIPVLFFFTGTHKDYHKPTDDVDKINFTGEFRIIQYIINIIKETNDIGKITFSKTREPQMSSARFTVSLGIMPDYTFSGSGVRADGIIDGKIASKVGMQAGDIIVKLGDFTITDLNTYMTALSKYKKGDATKVTVQRAKKELIFDIVF